MAKSSPTLLDFVRKAIPSGSFRPTPSGTFTPAEKSQRSSLIKQIAQKLVDKGEAKNFESARRTVQRRLTEKPGGQTRGEGKSATKTERAAARKYFRENAKLDEKADGMAARTDASKYRLVSEAYKTEDAAQKRAAQIQDGIKNRKAGGSPTKIDHANRVSIHYVPPGSKYWDVGEDNQSSQKQLTAGSEGEFTVTVWGD